MNNSKNSLRLKAREAILNQIWVRTTVLSSLLAIEDALGWISSEAVEEVAEYTHSTTNDIWAVASFYTNFRFTPPGEHTIEVCWGPSCHLRGGMRLAKHALDALGLSDDGDTPDGRMTFRFNTCLGACARAPVVSIDHKVMGPVDTEQLQKSLDEIYSIRM